MAWKPKEKQLTPEEAVALAKQELAPYWHGTEPLLAGVRGGDGKATAHPLDKSFEKKAWLLLFADLTDFNGEVMLRYVREWMRRYLSHELGLLLVVRQSYSFLSTTKGLPPVLGKTPDTFPIVVDPEGLITEAFGGGKQVYPAAKILHQRKVIFEHVGANWMDGAEKEIQRFLRLSDPGLPLAPSFVPAGAAYRDISSAELGSRARSPIFKVTGKFAQEADRIVVQDPAGSIRFACPASKVSIVLQSTASTTELSRMRVELNGDTVYDSVAAADLSFGDDGSSEVKVGEGRLYHLLQALPALKGREITLRFPDSDRLPVAIYGARFAN